MTTSLKPLAVVTGASRGIGFELARQFAEHGYDLIISADSDLIHQAAKTLSRNGASVLPVQADLATPDGVEEFFQTIKADGRPVACIALNAGIGVHGPFVETELKQELQMIALNATSVVHLAKLVVPDMVSQGSGRVLITSSIAAVMPAPFLAVYGATKAFLLSFAEALRNELKDTGVTVTALMPGATETHFFARAGMEDTKAGRSEKDDPADIARDGYDALMRGDDKVITHSAKTRFQGGLANFLPEALKAAMHRGDSEPGSARH